MGEGSSQQQVWLHVVCLINETDKSYEIQLI